jgi:hypothetical protein
MPTTCAIPDRRHGGSRNGSWTTTRCRSSAATTRLREHLLAQLGPTTLQRDRTLVAQLIDALDDDGYLTTSLEEIATLAPEELEIAPEEGGPRCRCCRISTLPAWGALACRVPAAARWPSLDDARARVVARWWTSICRCSPRATMRA